MLDHEHPLPLEAIPVPVPTPLAHRIPTAASRVDVSVSTMRRWIARGWLPAHEINGVVLVTEDDLMRFVREHRRS